MRLLKKAIAVFFNALFQAMIFGTTIMTINYFKTGYPHISEFCVGGTFTWFMAVIYYEGFVVRR